MTLEPIPWTVPPGFDPSHHLTLNREEMAEVYRYRLDAAAEQYTDRTNTTLPVAWGVVLWVLECLTAPEPRAS